MDPVVKTRPDAPVGFSEAEAAGFRWLAAAGGARIAGVVDVSPGRIALERVQTGRVDVAAAASFGEALAVTHESCVRVDAARRTRALAR